MADPHFRRDLMTRGESDSLDQVLHHDPTAPSDTDLWKGAAIVRRPIHQRVETQRALARRAMRRRTRRQQ